MDAYLADMRGLYRGASPLVVRPATTQEVAAVVRLCAEDGVSIVPQGGNTGLSGGAVAAGEVLLNLGRMNRVRAVDPLDHSITVEAGAVLAKIQRLAEDHDRLFPLSLGAEGSCQIGGNLSTNAGGTAVLRYGSMRELTLGLEVVLPDGRGLGRPARPAQGQYGLRFEAPVHRRRGHIGRDHGGGPEAVPAPPARATRRWSASTSPIRRSSCWRGPAPPAPTPSPPSSCSPAVASTSPSIMWTGPSIPSTASSPGTPSSSSAPARASLA